MGEPYPQTQRYDMVPTPAYALLLEAECLLVGILLRGQGSREKRVTATNGPSYDTDWRSPTAGFGPGVHNRRPGDLVEVVADAFTNGLLSCCDRVTYGIRRSRSRCLVPAVWIIGRQSRGGGCPEPS